MTEIIDLRSDTVTLPTPAMRKAMAEAEVGDDVMREDPTVRRLEELSAERMGKAAGLFVPTGTMGNLAAVLAHCGRGDEVIMGEKGHTFLFEAGGIAALGGVHPHTLSNQPDGTLKLDEIEAAIRPDDFHQPPTRLIILENTHNRCGGVVLSEAYTRSVGELAARRNLKLHLDGARIFNASVALGISASRLAAPADSVTFCLSKGLSAPVGSVLCGSEEFIRAARRIRKMLGAGMRQAGVIAAAGIVALEQMVDRLAEDHDRARRLGQRLAEIPGIQLDMGTPHTNMIFASLAESIPLTARQAAESLSAQRIKVGVVGARQFRLVVHAWVGEEAVERVPAAFRAILAG